MINPRGPGTGLAPGVCTWPAVTSAEGQRPGACDSPEGGAGVGSGLMGLHLEGALLDQLVTIPRSGSPRVGLSSQGPPGPGVSIRKRGAGSHYLSQGMGAGPCTGPAAQAEAVSGLRMALRRCVVIVSVSVLCSVSLTGAFLVPTDGRGRQLRHRRLAEQPRLHEHGACPRHGPAPLGGRPSTAGG